MNRREVGARYEQFACDYMEETGMQILERNYRRKIGEIDIVARDGEYLVFAEVKYRASTRQGGAFYAINAAKQQKIRRVAQWYLAEHRISPAQMIRFDAALIDGDQLHYLKNAW